jgi:GNAT superfamily N-acetyltransferase
MSVIRPATPADAAAIQETARQAWAVGYAGHIPEDVQAEYIASGYSQSAVEAAVESRIFLLACDGPTVLGFTQMELEEYDATGEEQQEDPQGPVRAYMGRLYIHPDAHRRGLGSALLFAGLAAIRVAVRRPHAVVLLSCSVQPGTEAHNFYRRMGFVLQPEPLPGVEVSGERCPPLFTCGYTRLFDAPANERPPCGSTRATL